MNPLIARFDPQKVEQHIDQLAPVGLRRRRVIIAVLGVIFNDRLNHQLQMLFAVVMIERGQQSRSGLVVVAGRFAFGELLAARHRLLDAKWPAGCPS